MTAEKAVSKLLNSGILPGIMGGLLAFAASNVWFYYFAAPVVPGLRAGNLMPDFFSFFQIDVYVGGASGYAGRLTAENLAAFMGTPARRARLLAGLYPVILGMAISLIVNALLLFMSAI